MSDALVPPYALWYAVAPAIPGEDLSTGPGIKKPLSINSSGYGDCGTAVLRWRSGNEWAREP